jgi:ribosomal protein S17E
MTENKTKATKASVAGYIAAIQDEERRSDCEQLVKLMTGVTGEPATMWGSSIVGFGRYHYRYESGREGDMCVTGFSSRKPNLSIYVLAEGAAQQKLLARLGKHKMAKGCLYVRRMADVDAKVLRELIAGSIAEVRKQFSGTG